MPWVFRVLTLVALSVGVGACGSSESRATDDGARQIRERFDNIEEAARTSLTNYIPEKSGSSLAGLYPEVLSYQVQGDQVTWHLYIKRTGRDNQSFSNSSTLQVASCIQLKGTADSLEATTEDCPKSELADNREHFNVEVDVLG